MQSGGLGIVCGRRRQCRIFDLVQTICECETPVLILFRQKFSNFDVGRPCVATGEVSGSPILNFTGRDGFGDMVGGHGGPRCMVSLHSIEYYSIIGIDVWASKNIVLITRKIWDYIRKLYWS